VLQSFTGATRTDYLYGLSRLASLNGSTRTWYVHDALGSVRRTVTDAGVPQGIITYDPWGSVESGTVPTFGFTGELHASAAGLVNLRARWYSTARGRFTTVDPFAGAPEAPYSLHQYAYGYSDPIGKRDPSGKNPAACFAALLLGPEAAPITGVCLAVALGATAVVGAYATYHAYQCAQRSCLVEPVQNAVNRFSRDVPDSPTSTANTEPPPPYQPLPGIEPQQPQRGAGIFAFAWAGPEACVTSGGFDLSPEQRALHLPFPLDPPQGPVVFAARPGYRGPRQGYVNNIPEDLRKQSYQTLEQVLAAPKLETLSDGSLIGRYIYVITRDGELRLATRKDHHHPNLVDGKNVYGAGQIDIDENGHIVAVDDISGHYYPRDPSVPFGRDFFPYLKYILQQKGITLPDDIFYTFK
jgi:RHS repeat-associated protein